MRLRTKALTCVVSLMSISFVLAPQPASTAPGDHTITTSATADGTLGETSYPFAEAVLSGPDDLDGISVHITSGHDPAIDRMSVGELPSMVTVDFDATTGLLRMRGAASLVDYESAIQSITYRQTVPSAGTREFLLIPASTPYLTTTGNLYQYVDVGTSITWDDARIAANTTTLGTSTGHLSNISSATENDFVVAQLARTSWIGGTDEAIEGSWRWADGPEAGQEYWSGTGSGSGGIATSGAYSNWAGTTEPNDFGTGEDYLYVSNVDGVWNDFEINNPTMWAYVVEFEQADFASILTLVTLTVAPPATPAPPEPAPTPTCVRTLADTYASASGVQGQIGRLYMAAFLRQPDAPGFSYWIGRANDGDSVWNIAEFFAGSSEFTSTYGGLADSQFIEQLYQNILCRPSESEGMEFWVAQLTSNTLTRAHALLLFADSSEFQGQIGSN